MSLKAHLHVPQAETVFRNNIKRCKAKNKSTLMLESEDDHVAPFIIVAVSYFVQLPVAG